MPVPLMLGPLAGTMAGSLGAGSAAGAGAAGAATAASAGLMSGFGSMLSGVSGFMGGSGQKYKGKYHKKYIKNEMESRLKYARKFGEQYGFHPLAALGISPSSVPMNSKSSSVGRGLNRMGQSLQRVSATGMSELQKAQIENIKAETNLINKRAADISKAAPYNTGENTPIAETGQQASYTNLPMPKQAPTGGRQLGEKGAEVVNFNPGGYLIIQPSEGLEDLVSEDINAKIRFYAPHWSRMVKGWATHGMQNQHTNTAARFRNATRLYIAGLEASHPPPKGMMYVWSIKGGTVKRVPRKSKHRLFDETTKYAMQVEFIKNKGTLLDKYRKWYKKTMDKYH